MASSLCSVVFLAAGCAVGAGEIAQDPRLSVESADPARPSQAEIRQEGRPGHAVESLPIQRRFPYPIKLKGLVTKPGSASVLVEIKGVRLFLRLGQKRPLGSGLSGEVVFSELDEWGELHLHFPGEYASVVFREEYAPPGLKDE